MILSKKTKKIWQMLIESSHSPNWRLQTAYLVLWSAQRTQRISFPVKQKSLITKKRWIDKTVTNSLSDLLTTNSFRTCTTLFCIKMTEMETLTFLEFTRPESDSITVRTVGQVSIRGGQSLNHAFVTRLTTRGGQPLPYSFSQSVSSISQYWPHAFGTTAAISCLTKWFLKEQNAIKLWNNEDALKLNHSVIYYTSKPYIKKVLHNSKCCRNRFNSTLNKLQFC